MFWHIYPFSPFLMHPYFITAVILHDKFKYACFSVSPWRQSNLEMMTMPSTTMKLTINAMEKKSIVITTVVCSSGSWAVQHMRVYNHHININIKINAYECYFHSIWIWCVCRWVFNVRNSLTFLFKHAMQTDNM